MKTWLRLAARNLFRNGRRSLVTVAAIGLGFVAVNTLGGFTAYIFSSLEDSYIYGEGNGHLTVYKAGFLRQGKLDPARYLLAPAELARARDTLLGDPEVLLATPALHIAGLLSNGQVSTIFVAAGRVPSDVAAIMEQAPNGADRVRQYDGEALDDARRDGIGVSRGLARQLNLELGGAAVAMAPTVSGQINALDVRLAQLVDAPVEALEDKLAAVPLAFAQGLYDTGGADRVTVLLRAGADADAARDRLAGALAAAGLEVELRTWREQAPFYTKVKKMFDVIFLIAFQIVFTIVVMSVLNTVGMAVMERTREIGTLRALGVRRGGIVGLFALESALLGAAGALCGMAVLLLQLYLLRLLEPTWVPPQITREVPLRIYLVGWHWLASVLLLLLLSLAAAVAPARKAARMDIPRALGYT